MNGYSLFDYVFKSFDLLAIHEEYVTKQSMYSLACTQCDDLEPSLNLTRIRNTCFIQERKKNTTQSMVIIYCLNANKELAEVYIKSPTIQHLTKLLVLYLI